MVSEAEFSHDESLEAADANEAVTKGPSRWYAIQVASGCEKKVKASLEQRIQTLDVADRVLQIEIPQTPV
ncbi:MAG: transcription termination/antitermination protein NusG, partial [Leptolyngbya sp. SIO1D8]|nr:transcription termination/antitermination protein NusG [Leptolyngbya sp. SIO1D8]